MNHLTSDEVIDAVEETLSPRRRAHLAGCDDCRHQVAQMAAMFSEVRGIAVPEPSPLFWDRFSDRVRSAIAAEAALPPRLTRWFQWPVLVPLGALTALVLALASALPHRIVGVMENEAAFAVIDTAAAGAPAEADAHWELVAALVGDVDLDAAEEAGLRAGPGTADEAVMQLSSAEQEELLRLLRQELERSGG